MSVFRAYVDRLLDGLMQRPDEIALVHDGRTVLGSEHATLVYGLARALSRHGLTSGQRVAILTANTPEVVATRHAAHLLGCAVALLPPGSSQATAQFVGHLAPEVLVVPEQAVGAVPDLLGLVETDVLSLGPVSGVADLLELAAKEPADAVAGPARPDDLGCIFCSGGTTGPPKGSCHTFGTYTATVTGAELGIPRLLVATPMAYLAQVLVDQALTAGGQVVLLDRFDPSVVLKQLQAHRITHLFLVEPLLFEFIDHPDLATTDTSSLEWLLHIGAAASPSRLEVAVQRLGPVLCHSYGSSEAGLVTMLAPHDLDPNRPELLQTSGRALPGVELLISALDGQPASTGEPGDIWVRSPRITTGYWRQPELTARLLRDGWLHTGDVGYLDTEGYLHMLGRRKDVVTINGTTVFPSRLENVLYAHPEVRAAAVFNTPAPSGEPRLVAVVVPRPGAQVTASQLQEQIRERLSSAYVPNTVVFADHFPVTAQGKPDAVALRALAVE